MIVNRDDFLIHIVYKLNNLTNILFRLQENDIIKRITSSILVDKEIESERKISLNKINKYIIDDYQDKKQKKRTESSE